MSATEVPSDDEYREPRTPIRFGEGFWQDHAGKLVRDPEIAIVEIVANCWDAGADTVHIEWPEEPDVYGKPIAVIDNGTGMTYEEFMYRWTELNYNRAEAQGSEVIFPEDNTPSQRRAFGTNGKGRHSMFCFDFTYTVNTWRDGIGNTFRVEKVTSGRTPYTIEALERYKCDGHGTEVRGTNSLNHLPVDRLRDLIGSKFVADPSFRIYVNGELIELTDLSHITETVEIPIDDYGTITVSLLDSRKTGRTMKQHGVAWWVNSRLVGQPSWEGIDGRLLDGRTVEAKRFTFIVQADILADHVRYDWTCFKDSPMTDAVLCAANEHIQNTLGDMFSEDRAERKRNAVQANREILNDLPRSARRRIGTFADEIQRHAPTISQEYLTATVTVLANLEESRTGYRLLEQLAQLSVDDLDALSDLLDSWSVREAQIVLEELERRLHLIEQLERVVETKSDELHVIHPLFERGLWIFGPEYESINFTSNRTLNTVVRDLFHDAEYIPENGGRRPDFVALPDSSIGVMSAEEFDDEGVVSGIDRVLIIELKRGGFKLTLKDARQAEDYALELRKSGKLSPTTRITCYVLGASVDSNVEKRIIEGAATTTIIPHAYSTILRQAQARTFYLKEKIEAYRRDAYIDTEVEDILNQPHQQNLL